MGSAVLQYSHCSSDTTRKRWAGHAGAGLGARALGRHTGGRKGRTDARGAQQAGR